MRLRQMQTQLTVPLFSTKSINNLRADLNEHITALVDLHYRTRQRPIPKLSVPLTPQLILQTIWTCCPTLEVALLVTRAVIGQWTRRKIALRANMIYTLKTDGHAWPVVEWEEDDDTQVIVVFHFDDLENPTSCSWLVHTGKLYSQATKRWMKSAVEWNIADLGHLKTLFVVAEHTLGVMQWEFADALRLYCHSYPEESSKEEYVHRRFCSLV